MTFSVLDLFSGVGAYSLGLERTGGFKTAAFCEIEAYPRLILRKHWPDVPTYNDVRELTGAQNAARGGLGLLTSRASQHRSDTQEVSSGREATGGRPNTNGLLA